MTEEQFWKCTPAKFFALVDCHKEFVGAKEEEREVYADDVW
jgi:hypothetical protein